MHHCTDTQAVCRGCGMHLDGSPYFRGGHAYHPRTGKHALANHFGGWVCSEACDRLAHLRQEQDMPGHGGQRDLDPHTSREISRKWEDY